ncbi:hypothetical protein RHS01_02017 [Rhizoctonia solani]|uniref:Uncharacterized protein n=1 Tax=Rhizoctonia solani TaxID=456999 RepID=A0A8H7IJS3_9AGAM|nr:hypothetical protein RHS01_02017 [Rhizoctonia solani]
MIAVQHERAQWVSEHSRGSEKGQECSEREHDGRKVTRSSGEESLAESGMSAKPYKNAVSLPDRKGVDV